uniref:Phage protein n=1 Tax=Siphoviridae sp. ct7xv9 TaxID=2825355 RepID=A0A8S5PNU0_9CAUD|nr:MAG TPA: Protein of unknown function (DUF1642) [Siphoviridae sp. ct7xv9]
MNKQELIDYCNVLKESKSRFINCIDVDRIINTIKQLDEPEEVKIPQFVADYIEFQKKNNFHVYGAMRVIEDHHDKRVPEWFYEGNVEKFCLAWILGYEVEEEKRYYIRLKNVDENYNYLNYIKHLNAWCLAEMKKDKKFRTTHTRKELEESDFGWVFDCPGIEIEEVE